MRCVAAPLFGLILLSMSCSSDLFFFPVSQLLLTSPESRCNFWDSLSSIDPETPPWARGLEESGRTGLQFVPDADRQSAGTALQCVAGGGIFPWAARLLRRRPFGRSSHCAQDSVTLHRRLTCVHAHLRFWLYHRHTQFVSSLFYLLGLNSYLMAALHSVVRFCRWFTARNR